MASWPSAGLVVASESGAGDEVIKGIAGHICRGMLSRYSHVRMEEKRRALDETAARQGAADQKRRREPRGGSRGAMVSRSAVVQQSSRPRHCSLQYPVCRSPSSTLRVFPAPTASALRLPWSPAAGTRLARGYRGSLSGRCLFARQSGFLRWRFPSCHGQTVTR